MFETELVEDRLDSIDVASLLFSNVRGLFAMSLEDLLFLLHTLIESSRCTTIGELARGIIRLDLALLLALRRFRLFPPVSWLFSLDGG